MSKEKPTGLPAARETELPRAGMTLQANIDAARKCEGCGKPGRVVSNYLGINVHCGPCKRHWPISSAPMSPETPMSTARGLSKQTLVEPDWGVALDRDIGEQK